jgi:hypothetical protein
MQTVYPGERKLKRKLMRQIWKEMFINLIKKIMGRKPEEKTKEPPNDQET